MMKRPLFDDDDDNVDDIDDNDKHCEHRGEPFCVEPACPPTFIENIFELHLLFLQQLRNGTLAILAFKLAGLAICQALMCGLAGNVAVSHFLQMASLFCFVCLVDVSIVWID